MKHKHAPRPLPVLNLHPPQHSAVRRACLTPPQLPRPVLREVLADQAAWQREQRQRDLIWQQLKKLEAQALNR